MNGAVRNLRSALSSLKAEFAHDPEKLHLAVGLVFSSIFKAYGAEVVVVGGQAASYWLRIGGSTDVDFVARDFESTRDTLASVGFVTTNAPFRLIHGDSSANASVLIELVGEAVEVAGIRPAKDAVITVVTADIESPTIRRLMMGDALVMDPGLSFLNYAEASLSDSQWHDIEDQGGLALDRATALLELYRPFITDKLRTFVEEKLLSERLRRLLVSEFHLDLG